MLPVGAVVTSNASSHIGPIDWLAAMRKESHHERVEHVGKRIIQIAQSAASTALTF
jgi:hypothetical protein